MTEGHEVYAVVRDAVAKGTVTNIDNDGHYVVRTDEGVAVTCARSDICHTAVSSSAPPAQTVCDTAELRHGDDHHTVKLFSRASGQSAKQAGVSFCGSNGELTHKYFLGQ